ncbi:hypothetical protein [Haloarcula montana]|uniref:hypothetical protein n=1 Tax=Haloarcula montana TaxID=3111776 RepID=UPI002D785441|nr:hypothetical protein [Haloarcula sp. GH36]
MSSIEFASLRRTDAGTGLSTWARLRTVLFGDRIGLAIFLGSLCLFMLAWRTTVFITDTYTIVNGLYAVSNGHIGITEAVYGGNLDTPGMTSAGGRTIARNYGAIVLSLPFLALVESLDAITSLRIGIAALWSILALGVVVQTRRVLDSDAIVWAGSVLVLVVFAANVVFATPLDDGAAHLYALQLFHMTVAAFGPVVLYRLLRRIDGPRMGVLGATVYVLGSPLVIWATVPKRHVLTATVAVGIMYFLYRSRAAETDGLIRRPAVFRAFAYALVMLYAWVHAPEALLLCVVLAAVDLPTAADNGPRALATIAAVSALALVPFLVTNELLTGSVVTPSRLLRNAGPAVESTAASAGQSSSGRSSGIPIPDPVLSILRPFTLLGGELLLGFRTAFSQPEDVFLTFLRSGHASGTLNNDNTEAVNLAILESAPILAATVGVLPAVWRRRESLGLPSRVLSPTRVVDSFAVLAALGVCGLYLSRLPLHAQVTVRYLFVLYPLGIYLLFRTPSVRDALDQYLRSFAWALAVTVLLGGQLLVVFVALSVNGIGEAFQLHALLALGSAAPLAAWGLFGRSDGWFGRVGAGLFGVATGLTTIFAWLTVVEYYALGNAHALPIVRYIGQLLELF